jgi:L-xylulose reductase
MGRVIAGRLLGLDAHVFAIGRDIESLPCKAGQKMTKIAVDIGDWDSTYCKILEIGPVHGLVNNAGVAHIEPFLDTTQHGWDKYEYRLTFY